MTRAASFLLMLTIVLVVTAPGYSKYTVKNYATGPVIDVSLMFPGLNGATTAFKFLEEPEKFPEILTARMTLHKGRKYLCGLAKTGDPPRTGRYVISMEVDWQIWEPRQGDLAWHSWNDTFEEICGSVKGEE